jgi:hypothetical protein
MAELSRDEHIRSLVDEHPDRPPPRIDPGILVQAGEGSRGMCVVRNPLRRAHTSRRDAEWAENGDATLTEQR